MDDRRRQGRWTRRGLGGQHLLREGTKEFEEFEEFERRNGFNKEPIPVNGLLMEQHSM
jgi:hypothetical protein